MSRLPPDHEKQVQHYLVSGQDRNEEDVLRDAFRALADNQASLDDIRQGLKDLDDGRGRRLENVDTELRKEYNIPHDV